MKAATTASAIPSSSCNSNSNPNSNSNSNPGSSSSRIQLQIPMDSRIWRNLPQGMLDRVLAFLPPPAFFRARSVCKRWYALLFSDSFLEAHLHLSPPRFFFLFFHHSPSTTTSSSTATVNANHPSSSSPPPHSAGFLFDPETDTWYLLPFDLIIPSNYSPAASSGGLLCWISDDASVKTLILCNPLSKLSSQLPSTMRPRLFPSVGLTAGPSSLSLVVAGDDLISPFAVKNLTAESFHADGVTGFYSPWATMSPLPRLCNIEPARMVFSGGKFYCMSCGPFSVLAYDVGANEWSKIQAPMRRFLRSPSLVVSGGGGGERVVMVAAVEKSKLSVPRSVRVWGLQPCGRAWTEVERMPQEVYWQFGEAEGGRGFECGGHGNLIAITIKGSCDVLLFDFHQKEWRWARPCPFVRGGSLRGFAYEPRLATPAIGLLHSSFSAG